MDEKATPQQQQQNLRVFAKYAHQDQSPGGTSVYPALEVFMCKCAIIDLFGLELKKKELVALLGRYCPSALEDGFVSRPEFLSLCEGIQETLPVNIHMKNMYNSLDPTKKGYITEDDFMAVFFSLAPRLATARGREIYRAADSYSIGKVRANALASLPSFICCAIYSYTSVFNL
jgi:hypothetical protein